MALTPLGYIVYYLFRCVGLAAAIRLGIRDWRLELADRQAQKHMP